MRSVDEFDRFLEKAVNLSPGRLSTLEQRVKTIEEVLRQADTDDLVIVDARRQGSAAQGTIINPRDEHRGFDADVLLECEDRFGAPEDLLKSVEASIRASARHADMIKRRTRCITMEYAGEFHLDVVPCVRRYGTLHIANRDINQWEPTDPDGFNDWLATRNEIANGHLVHAIRLIKFLRDYKGRPRIKSVILSTLLASMVEARNTGDFEDLPTTLVILLEDLARYCASFAAAPYLTEPTCSAALRLDDTDWPVLTRQVQSLAGRAREAYAHPHEKGTLARWRALFGHRFPAPDQRVVEAALDRGEQDLYQDFGIPTLESESVTVEARVRPKDGFRHGLIHGFGRLGRGRTLTFKVTSTTVTEPYDAYWKVKNTGDDARRADGMRGEITLDTSRPPYRQETTKWVGDHWVDVYIVKDSICVAKARANVPI